MFNWIYKNRVETIILLIMGAFVNAGCYLQMHGLCLTFFDSDDYMRLVRIKEFFSHYDLSNNIISRCNIPFGCELHWTRFYDFFIIIPVYILSFFVNSIDKSIEYVGFFIGPVIKSVTIVVFFSISQRLMKKDNAFLLTAIFSAHPLILPFGIFGRPDHHAFIMLFILIFIHHVTEIIESNFTNKKLFITTAVTTVFCVWISPETLIPLLLADGILFVYSYYDIEKLRLLYTKNIFVSCGIGMIIFFSSNSAISKYSLVMYILMMTLLYVTYDDKYLKNTILRYWHIAIIITLLILLPRITPVEYDRISVLHAALYLCSVAYFGINIINQKLKYKNLIVMSFLWLIIIAAVFLSEYPYFFKGMSADVDGYIKTIWLYKVAEMQSPFAHGDTTFFVIHCIIVATSIINKITQLVNRKFDFPDLIWWILIVNAICYTIFAGISCRMLPYSVLFGLPFIVDFGMNSSFVESFHRLWRIVITSFLSIFFLFCTSYFDPIKKEKVSGQLYAQKELFKVIDNLSPTPEVIMAHSNDGPSILYYTKHGVVGAPYHRQARGIIFSHKIMSDQYNEEMIKSILRTTNSSYIFIRKSQSAKAKQENLVSMIIHNNLPEWASIVKLPKKFNDVLIVKIDKKKLNP
ncbi:MAG: hypothetical protein LBQ08_01805 [Holosporaceae bacterium]|nr:hypothetical protein [Holosporaceae bacterium]